MKLNPIAMATLTVSVCVLSACSDGTGSSQKHATVSVTDTIQVAVGTVSDDADLLHNANALAWQKASFQRKRETCSKVLLALHERGNLPVHDLNHTQLKLLSDALVQQMNKRLEMTGTETQNQETFEHVKVSTTLIEIIEEKDWLIKS